MRSIVLGIMLAFSAPSAACERPACRTVFEDAFHEADGGWDFEGAKIMSVRPPGLIIAPTSKISGAPMLNLTFAASIGAFCMDVVLPKPPTPDNVPGAGITFWATDYEHRDIFFLYSNGIAILFNRTNGIFYQIYREEHVRGFDAADGAVNSLCVAAGKGNLTLILNKTVLKVVRAQVPDVPLRFGIEGGVQTAIADAPQIKVRKFTVLSPERP